jgi:hypothetical protein
MALIVTHTTAADGTFSSAGATAWNATHAIAGTLDLVTETTGSLDLATRTTGSLDLLTRSTGTIDLLTQTRGATATQLMYGGASGQVAQSSGMVWDQANTRLTVTNRIRVESSGTSVDLSPNGLTKTAGVTRLLLQGFQAASGTSVGGPVELIGGNASVSADGGAVLLRGGTAAGSTGSNSGGAIDAIAGGASFTDPTGNGGSVSFQAGEATGASAFAGKSSIIGGFANSGGTAGDAELIGGACVGSTGTPGNILLTVGDQSTGSTVGNIVIGSVNGNPVAVTAGTGASHTADLPVIVDGNQYYIRLYS